MKRFYNLLVVGGLVLLPLSLLCRGANFYVDFSGGSDANSGATTNAAWKHCPGDPNAAGAAKVALLNPGDMILFKGGVTYRGVIRPDFSGTQTNPITLKGDGWGATKAIISGAEYIGTSWQQCTNATDAHGNIQFSNIWWTTSPTNMSWFTPLFSGDTQFFFSQDPTPTNFLSWQELSYYRHAATNRITQTSLTDTNYFIQSDSNYWSGAFIAVYVVPNEIEVEPIDRYDPATHTIYFSIHATLQADATGSFVYYKTINHPAIMDAVGETAVLTNENRLYIYATNNPNAMSMEAARRSGIIVIQKAKNLIIRGFEMKNASSGQWASYGGNWQGTAISVIPNNYGDCTNCTIRDCEIFNCRGKPDSLASEINVSKTPSIVISNNIIRDCLNRAIVCGYGMATDATGWNIVNNTIMRVAGSGMLLNGTGNVSGNTISQSGGTHTDGIATYNCWNVAVAGNIITSRAKSYTIDYSTNMTIYNNVFDSTPFAQSFSDWGGCASNINVFNNIIIGDTANWSLAVYNDSSNAFYRVFNNIIAGSNVGIGNGWPFHTNCDAGWNVYCKLVWMQDVRDGYQFGLGDSIIKDTSLLFYNLQLNDYRLTKNSQIASAGTNLSKYFHTDINGIARSESGSWSIGPYATAPSSLTAPINLRFMNK